jgi:hypothetical protein
MKICNLVNTPLEAKSIVQHIKMKISHRNKLHLWPMYQIPMLLVACNILVLDLGDKGEYNFTEC